MNAAAIGESLAPGVGLVNGGRRQTVRVRRPFTSVLPIAPVRDRIVRDFERGVSLAALCILNEARSKAVQQVIRERLRELERVAAAAARNAAAAAALCLAAAVGWDAWECARHDDGAAVQRAFRGRGRRTRREAELDSVWAEMPVWNA